MVSLNNQKQVWTNTKMSRKEERYEEKSNECSFGSSDGCGYGR